MLRAAKPDYVCWRCVSRSALPSTRATTPGQQQALSTSSQLQRVPAKGSRPRKPGHGREPGGGGLYTPGAFDKFSYANIKKRLDVGPIRANAWAVVLRQELDRWEAAHANEYLEKLDKVSAAPKAFLGHGFAHGDGIMRDTVLEEGVMQPLGEADGMADTGTTASNLHPGDLVEINHSSNTIPILAVYLGKYHAFDHFFSEDGEWFTSPGIRTRFVVRGFIADPADLLPILDALPDLPDSPDLINQLSKVNPSRETGAVLIRKMQDFQNDARILFQENIDRFNALYTTLTARDPEEQLVTLNQLARLAYPIGIRQGATNFPSEHLYALFTYLVIHEDHFRPIARGHRDQNACLFAVNSLANIRVIDTVEAAVRDYLASPTRDSPSATAFKDFILQAQKVIDRSRKSRDWSTHGMIGPIKRRAAPPTTEWSPLGLAIIRHMYLWTATDMVRGASRRHWVGSAILRELGRYGDAEYQDQAVGWTFLQEIAYITPWDLRARHLLRLPGVELDKCGGLAPLAKKDGEELLGPDRLAHLRRDFGDATVYCIDAKSADDIDDGISLEPTGDGDHWIHVHVADPASRIAPDSPLARRATLVPQTMYLPGHFSRMLDDDIVRDTFSLSPNGPSLVFSARVTDAGDIVDRKITPATIRNVVYLTPDTVATVTGGDPLPPTPPPPTPPFEVGTPPPPAPEPSRPMTTTLTPAQQSDLLTLHRLAHALHKHRLARGAIPSYPDRPTTLVSLDPTTATATPSPTPSQEFVLATGDPYIAVSYTPQTSPMIVSSLMILAGTVAASYLSTRRIPAPFRIQPVPAQTASALEAFARDVLYPTLLSGRAPPASDLRAFWALAGASDVSVVARPHFCIGEDRYVRATSPLRRAGDLIVHWQVEAALLAEAEGRDVTGGAGLPFSRDDMEAVVLPQLRVREQHGRMLDKVEGPDQWMLQALVRAWKFGEAEVPGTMRLVVTAVMPGLGVSGVLVDWFERAAMMEIKDLGSVARMAEVRAGDEFVVRLRDVNVHARSIRVEAVERVVKETEGGESPVEQAEGV
ncbi:mitochondrial protein cyt-4 [Podospora conica]|nr:mitochondrial protein cyt-4 [Schizothecium conicum]